MPADLFALATYLDKLPAKIAEGASQVAVLTTLAIVADLGSITPVDIGTAMSNWDVTLDTPALDDFHPAFEPGVPFQRTGPGQVNPNAPATREANLPILLDVANAILSNKIPGQSIFITNNTPYIVDLDNGTSVQAPAGFVDRSLIVGRETAPAFRIL